MPAPKGAAFRSPGAERRSPSLVPSLVAGAASRRAPSKGITYSFAAGLSRSTVASSSWASAEEGAIAAQQAVAMATRSLGKQPPYQHLPPGFPDRDAAVDHRNLE